MTSTSNLVFITIGLIRTFILFSIIKIIYRLFFHKLSRFPGPKLAAATFWYERYFDVFKSPTGQYIYQIEKLHDKYGPIVRISPEEVHIRDAEWFDTLYAGPGHVRHKWERSNRANGSPGSVASTTNHDHHRLRRGALNPFFSKKAINDLESKVREKVNLLCVKMAEYNGEVLSLGTAFTAVTLDVVTEYCFDKCQNCLHEPDFAPRWKALMTKIFDPVPISKHFPLVMNTMQKLPKVVMLKLMPDFEAFFECQEAIHTQAKSIWLAESQASKIEKPQLEVPETRPKTIFHGILQSKLSADEKAVERMADEAFVLIVAGGETTARVLTHIFANLLQDTQLLTELRKVIDAVMPTDSDELPSSRKLEEIPLLKAVIQEGLRIASPLTNRPILIAPNEDLSYKQYIIPRGTPMSMTLGDVLYDPAIFPEPKEFRPKRWLETAEKGQRLDRHLVTFSKGTRACIGMNLAVAELYLGVAALVKRFDMELQDYQFERDLMTVRDNFIGLPSVESRGVRVKVKNRLSV